MKPRVRPINAFPIEVEGRKLICLQDPMKITDKTVFIDYHTYFIITMMDGKNEISDIQLAYTRQFGELLLNSQLDSLLNDLEDNLFLEGNKYASALKQLKQSFTAEPVRHAAHAGTAYELEPGKLHKQLDKIMDIPAVGKKNSRKLKALIAPHIDIQAGAEGYANTYCRVSKDSSADLYIILGVSHADSRNEFITTSKDFETPLGISGTDKDFVSKLEDSLPASSGEDEFIHKSEHSIEFQIVFLQHVLGDRDYKIVPILCAGFHEQLEKGKMPEEDKAVKKFLEKLRNKIEEYKGNVCIIAGVDLSHVGTKFGSVSPITTARLPAIEQLDREMLDDVVNCDVRGFYRKIEIDKNGRNVCGFGAIYTLLYLLGDMEGELFHYGQNYQPETSSVVSFASMAFY